MIVGQAVYGWPDGWRAAEADTVAGRAKILEFTLARNADASEPIGWIENSDRRDRPFWRSCRLLVEALAPTSTAPWWGRFTWANLYPVAWEADPNAPPGSPAAHADNPGGELKKAQDPFVADLLRATIEWLNSAVVVVLGGPYWWPASSAVAGLTERPRPLMRAGRAEGRTWVIGWHPNGANRRGFTPERYVPIVIDAVNGSGS